MPEAQAPALIVPAGHCPKCGMAPTLKVDAASGAYRQHCACTAAATAKADAADPSARMDRLG